MNNAATRAFGQEIEENFGLTQLFQSYVSKPEITALAPSYLVPGSQNVLIDYAQRVISRNGYTLYGPAAYQTVSGAELIVNGAFGTDLSSWSLVSGPVWASGRANMPVSAQMYQALTLVVGTTYTLTFEYQSNGSGYDFQIGPNIDWAYTGSDSDLHTGSVVFTATQAQVDVGAFFVQTNTIGVYIDNISLKSLSVLTTAKGPITASYDWETSTSPQYQLRAYDHTLQFDFNDTYNSLLTNLRSTQNLAFAPVLDYTEQQDVLLFVNADSAKMNRWSGGASKVASSTATTVKKAGVMTAVTTIAFVAGNGSTLAPTIIDSAGGFVTAGFAVGDTLHVTGSVSNNSNFTIASVAAGTLTLVISDSLTNEAAGSSVTLYNQTGPTWKSARFFKSASGRAITYNGVSYTYSGGETTDTLTGLTAFPTVAAGDVVWQTPDSITLPSDITTPFPLFYPDLIAVQLNMVFLGSTQSQMVFASKSSDYTNFALTTPRAPGDGAQQPLTSGNCTAIVPIDNDANTLSVVNTLMFGSGIDAWDQIDFRMSQDNSQELLRIIRYKTAKGSGLISKHAICPIKNATVYVSREPALDYLGAANLEAQDGRRNVPISDSIKNDFDNYDFTNADVKYHKRAIYIALPAHGVVLIYDMMRNLWQPPQTMPISRFAIIDDELYGHSSVTNETYKLFTGTNDNGNIILQIARFAYNNGGTRQRLKNFTEYWTDGYITAGAELDYTIYLGYSGNLGLRVMTILGDDTAVAVLEDATPLGNEAFGNVPLGGASFDPITGLPGAGVPLGRFYQIDTVDPIDYTEHFVEYKMLTLDGQFAIIAHGTNQFDAGTAWTGHKK